MGAVNEGRQFSVQRNRNDRYEKETIWIMEGLLKVGGTVTGPGLDHREMDNVLERLCHCRRCTDEAGD